MDLAPMIERYMDLNRQERAVKNEVDLMEQNTPLSTRQYKHIFELVTECFCPGGQPQLSSLNQVNLAKIAEHEAELADMSKVMDDFVNKIAEIRIKMTNIARQKDAIKVLLQQR